MFMCNYLRVYMDIEYGILYDLNIYIIVHIYVQLRGWSEKFPTSTWRWQHSSMKASECSCASFDGYSLKFQPIWTRSF